jgi:hypothetical protein
MLFRNVNDITASVVMFQVSTYLSNVWYIILQLYKGIKAHSDGVKGEYITLKPREFIGTYREAPSLTNVLWHVKSSVALL